jgi:hypothetical protein
MKALLLFGLLVITSAAFISATKKSYHPNLSRDEMFTKSVNVVSSLEAVIQSGDKVRFDNEFRKLANSIAILQEKYPDLKDNSSASAINRAMDDLARENKMSIHGDTCLKNLVTAVFACFRSCLNNQALKVCLSAACASYQDCKVGGSR